ncbi:MAG: helix-hairpin-helix domain-containing protein [Oscillospiraceae bacterium]|nr:helix-hairpin-helix domain-containing protein [Oscillospiraceae bacterium]
MGAVCLCRRAAPAGSVRTEFSRRAAEQIAPVNLNTAHEEELERLPGIGAIRAAQIIADRTQNGPFQSVEDILRVRGIGSHIYQQIRDLVYVEGEYENWNH